MYVPQQPAVPTAFKQKITYKEWPPRQQCISTTHCFWELRSVASLQQDFSYLVLPDACIDIVFDTSDTPEFEGALVMTPSTSATTVNLGQSFSYIGIRLRPGAWRSKPLDIVGRSFMVDMLARQNLRRIRQQLVVASPAERLQILERLVRALEQDGVIGENLLVNSVLDHADEFASVSEIVVRSGYTRRHIQRVFQEQIGYSPHDFLKVIRFQRALNQPASQIFADQSHYIREFKRVTGMTPSMFQTMYG